MTTPAGAAADVRRFQRAVLDYASRFGPEKMSDFLVRNGMLGLRNHPRLPPPVAARLREAHRASTYQNLLHRRAYRQVAEALGPIEQAPLKGILLLDSVYADDIGARPMGDVDLLVAPDRVDAARDRLAEAGFRDYEHLVGLRAALSHHRVCVSPQGVIIEIHGRLLSDFGFHPTLRDIGHSRGETHGCPSLLLEPEWVLVHLLVHLAAHGFLARMSWIQDVVAWHDQWSAELDPARIARVCERFHVRRPVWAAVTLIRTVVPGSLARVPAPPVGSRAVVRAHAALFLPPAGRLESSTLAQPALWVASRWLLTRGLLRKTSTLGRKTTFVLDEKLRAAARRAVAATPGDRWSGSRRE